MPRLFPATGLLALSALLLAGPTTAQPIAAQTAQPAAQAPQPPGASAFDGYRRFDPQPIAPWRESNDTVGRIGGWKVYAREAQQPEPASPSGAAAPAQRSDAPAPTAPAASTAPPAASGGHRH